MRLLQNPTSDRVPDPGAGMPASGLPALEPVPDAGPVAQAVATARAAMAAARSHDLTDQPVEDLAGLVRALSALEAEASALMGDVLGEAERRQVADSEAATGTDAWAAALTGQSREVLAGGARIAELLRVEVPPRPRGLRGRCDHHPPGPRHRRRRRAGTPRDHSRAARRRRGGPGQQGHRHRHPVGAPDERQTAAPGSAADARHRRPRPGRPPRSDHARARIPAREARDLPGAARQRRRHLHREVHHPRAARLPATHRHRDPLRTPTPQQDPHQPRRRERLRVRRVRPHRTRPRPLRVGDPRQRPVRAHRAPAHRRLERRQRPDPAGHDDRRGPHPRPHPGREDSTRSTGPTGTAPTRPAPPSSTPAPAPPPATCDAWRARPASSPPSSHRTGPSPSPSTWAGRRRLHSHHQRKALALVHDTCAIGTCERPFAWSEIHHLIPWAHHGDTDLETPSHSAPGTTTAPTTPAGTSPTTPTAAGSCAHASDAGAEPPTRSRPRPPTIGPCPPPCPRAPESPCWCPARRCCSRR